MRSLLLVPGHDAEALAAAMAAGADAVVVFLTGGASGDRAAARRVTRSVLWGRQGGDSAPLVFVGLHDREGPIRQADLEAVVPAAPDGVVLPRSGEKAAVERLDARLAVQEALHGLPDRSTRIVAATGDRDAPLPSTQLYRGISPRLAALAWMPAGTWLADGAPEPPTHGGGGPEEFTRNMTVLAAAGSSLPAIHAAWPDAGDIDGLRAVARRARHDGFSGMFAADAGQIPTIHEEFACGER